MEDSPVLFIHFFLSLSLFLFIFFFYFVFCIADFFEGGVDIYTAINNAVCFDLRLKYSVRLVFPFISLSFPLLLCNRWQTAEINHEFTNVLKT